MGTPSGVGLLSTPKTCSIHQSSWLRINFLPVFRESCPHFNHSLRQDFFGFVEWIDIEQVQQLISMIDTFKKDNPIIKKESSQLMHQVTCLPWGKGGHCPKKRKKARLFPAYSNEYQYEFGLFFECSLTVSYPGDFINSTLHICRIRWDYF